jgi:hypothetical protein
MNHDDIVDWPQGERDGFVFTPVNTVINAFHLRTLNLMTVLARALHQDADADHYAALESSARAAFQENLFDPVSGLYRDGEGTEHSSLHANLFPLAFDLVPPERRAFIAEWLANRGMVCSVYSAQYLLEGLFENDQAAKAIALITAPTDRSWRHMVESGATITWEAWDQRYKPNQDWNHAWGAAPANLLPRYVLGAQSLAPGWRRTTIRPNPGSLQSAEGRIPTPLGPIQIRWENRETFKLALSLPVGMRARVELPASSETKGVLCAGTPAPAHREGFRWILEKDVTGAASFEVR